MAKQRVPFGQGHVIARSSVLGSGTGITPQLYGSLLAQANKTGQPVTHARGTINPTGWNQVSGLEYVNRLSDLANSGTQRDKDFYNSEFQRLNQEFGSIQNAKVNLGESDLGRLGLTPASRGNTLSSFAGGGTSPSSGSFPLPATQEQAVAQANAANTQRQQQIESLFDQMLSNLQGVGQTRRDDINEEFAQRQGQTQQDLISRGLYNTTTGAALPTFIEGRKQREITALEESLAQQRIGVIGERAGFLERIMEQAPSLSDFFNQQAAAASAPSPQGADGSVAAALASQSLNANKPKKITASDVLTNIRGMDPNNAIAYLKSGEAINALGTNQRQSLIGQYSKQLLAQNQPAATVSSIQAAAKVKSSYGKSNPASGSNYFSYYNKKTGQRRVLTTAQFANVLKATGSDSSDWINQGPYSR